MKRILPLGAAVAALIGLSACAGGSTPAPTTSAANPSAPAATTQSAAPAASNSQSAFWQPLGAFTGRWPPTNQPPAVWGPNGLSHTLSTPQGYKYTVRLFVGPPLHYAVPGGLTGMFDCGNDNTAPMDLSPGEYEVPYQVTVINDLNQQAVSPVPQVTSSTVTTSQAGSGSGTWQGGGCTMTTYYTMPANGRVEFYGMIGAATLTQLRQATITLSNPEMVAGDFPNPFSVSAPLAKLMRQGWLS